MEQLALTLHEQRALERGVATRQTRLKCGRIIFDGLEALADKPELGDALDALSQAEQESLKLWLEAQIDSYPDTLGGTSKELEEEMCVYRKVLNTLS